MASYFKQVREWLYKKRILPLILREKDMPGYISPKEIVEIMQRPCEPLEPSPFAKTLGSVLRGEYPSSMESELIDFGY